MRENFDQALDRLLIHEGGYSNHPSDPGGPTNYGITIIDYRKYINAEATADDVRRMSIEDAKAIYRARYWGALRCDELPLGVDYAVFDYGVNSGVSRAIKVLQRILGLEDDGKIGPETLRAVQRRAPDDLVKDICDERLRFLKKLKTWPVFGKGWGRRVAEVKSAALIMAQGATAAAPPTPGVSVGTADEPPPPVTQSPSMQKTIGGIAATVLTAISSIMDWKVVAVAGALAIVAVLLFIGRDTVKTWVKEHAR